MAFHHARYAYALTARTVVVHEPIDPVRYIANRSSGAQGSAVAQALADSGRHAESLRHALIASRTADGNNAPLVLAAQLYHRQGKNTRALKQLDKAIEREPAN